ncbi:LL-diaminopimelate aminotransferase [Synechococcus elongatus]|uniref:Aminotransferase n=1 Tax=Synechococcus elongatus (strain ATCC 33912 / PCC 7942 / FACHB-805) TaxID=1140 RepID=Q31M95_SYNE7|nr:LL-diaminopimelate aminotransferase [Synechococcus elongatus]ABB57824.1 aminotransferase [Synechococcus elongatus PCC 7942 = FACHB-805]AJD57691.1 succinyldiaminopimelate aminotransferase [Synechococcus elongatus UTEX 2973]MBD2586540.1 LL-diaminopimelate aminotransferase [Synechococcus elongatus FACHB-242]MBD2687614.1 LL-diaminopimelate aminotransferase [Synechococcus elongatus FACHB-1061]MBD2706677.1 LL-diaminopimelate aminotransferase [Synechococcus elongatus PCC 7942 = FACHB-805]
MPNFRLSQRLAPLQRNVFADMDRAKAVAIAAGREVIDLSLGSSDLPAPDHVVAVIAASLQDPSTHGYLLHQGTLPFRQVAAAWYERKFGLGVDPETEVLLLIGSQEGTAHLPLAVMEPGEIALLQDPGYPSHAGGVYLAGGEIYRLPTTADRGFLPDFSTIPTEILSRSRLLVLSYPHNPTTAIAPLAFFEEAVAFCRHHQLVLAHDFPYPDLGFDGVEVPSIFQADRQKQQAIEFFSLSKSYNMGGFRVGFAIGNAELIGALRRLKAVVDFNQYQGILAGAIAALTGPQACVEATRQRFRDRRDIFINALAATGWTIPKPVSTMYLWAPLPEPWQTRSLEFCEKLVAETGVAASPGIGFGDCGEGFVRFALVHDRDRLEEAARRITQFLAR